MKVNSKVVAVNINDINDLQNLERATGLEPATTSLEGWCATNCATPAQREGSLWAKKILSLDHNIPAVGRDFHSSTGCQIRCRIPDSQESIKLFKIRISQDPDFESPLHYKSLNNRFRSVETGCNAGGRIRTYVELSSAGFTARCH